MTKASTRVPMNAGLVEAAIRRHVDHRANTLIPEAAVRCGVGTPHFCEYRADFMMITASGYGTELEVKISRSDWRADLSKSKWADMPAWVTRFIYVVPEQLGIPEFVPEHAGVWHVVPRLVTLDKYTDEERRGADGYEIVLARAPKLLGREKVPAAVVAKWMRNFYYRYWDQRIHGERRIARHVREGVAA